MPHIVLPSVELHYEDRGRGSEAIVFSHGLLMCAAMFEAPIRSLEGRYRCIAYDHRGQGGSQITDGGYDMETLTADAASLIEALGAAPCHFAGLSMGGFVGLRLAIRRPELLRSLVLMETSGDAEPWGAALRYRVMALVARWIGTRPLVPHVMPILFGRTFLSDPARQPERDRWRRHLETLDRAGATRATMGVIGRPSVREALRSIRTPTLVIVGDEDVATPPFRAERLKAAIGSSKLVIVPRAGHSSPIEEPQAVTSAIESFLGSLPR